MRQTIYENGRYMVTATVKERGITKVAIRYVQEPEGSAVNGKVWLCHPRFRLGKRNLERQIKRAIKWVDARAKEKREAEMMVEEAQAIVSGTAYVDDDSTLPRSVS